MTKKTSPPSLITLALLISMPSLSALFFTPGIPHISTYFNISSSLTQLSVSIYLIGYALGLLIYGHLAKLYGRKKAIYLGLTIAIIGSISCTLSELFYSFNFLIFGRFILALGASSGYSVTFIIINDYYSHEKVRKIIPLVAIGLSTLPFASTVLGGFMVDYLGWSSTFYLLAVYILFVLFMSTRLPETKGVVKKTSSNLKTIILDYIHVMKYGRLPLFSLFAGSCVAIFYIFAGTAPFLAIHVMGLKSSEFGLMNLFIIAGNLLGILSASRLAKYMTGISIITFSLFFNLFSILVMIALFLFGIDNIWTLFIPNFFIFFWVALIWPNAAALATKNIPNKAYAACSMSFINISTGVIGVFIISAFTITNLLVMPFIFLGIALFQILLLLIANVKKYS